MDIKAREVNSVVLVAVRFYVFVYSSVMSMVHCLA